MKILTLFILLLIVLCWWFLRKQTNKAQKKSLNNLYETSNVHQLNISPQKESFITENQKKSKIDCIAKYKAGYYNISYNFNHDSLLEKAALWIIESQSTNIQNLKDALFVGSNRAERILNQLEALHILENSDVSTPRKILINDIDQIKLLIYSFGDTVFYNDNKTEIEERTQYYIQLKKEESEKEKKSVEEREKEEIKQRIIDRQRKRQIEKIITQELINEGTLFPEANKRPPIPKEVVDTVWNRDTGKCVYCGSTENLHLDHIIPFSKGGATNVENLQLLCQKCNLEKSNKIG